MHESQGKINFDWLVLGIMNTATLKVGFTAWMRNLMLLFNLTPNQKKLIDTPRRLHGWVQSHLVLKNEVHYEREVYTTEYSSKAEGTSGQLAYC